MVATLEAAVVFVPYNYNSVLPKLDNAFAIGEDTCVDITTSEA
jgi:hypothetical protein